MDLAPRTARHLTWDEVQFMVYMPGISVVAHALIWKNPHNYLKASHEVEKSATGQAGNKPEMSTAEDFSS